MLRSITIQQDHAGFYEERFPMYEYRVVRPKDKMAIRTKTDIPIPYDELSRESQCELFEYAKVDNMQLAENRDITLEYFFMYGVVYMPCRTYSIRLQMQDGMYV